MSPTVGKAIIICIFICGILLNSYILYKIYKDLPVEIVDYYIRFNLGNFIIMNSCHVVPILLAILGIYFVSRWRL